MPLCQRAMWGPEQGTTGLAHRVPGSWLTDTCGVGFVCQQLGTPPIILATFSLHGRKLQLRLWMATFCGISCSRLAIDRVCNAWTPRPMDFSKRPGPDPRAVPLLRSHEGLLQFDDVRMVHGLHDGLGHGRSAWCRSDD